MKLENISSAVNEAIYSAVKEVKMSKEKKYDRCIFCGLRKKSKAHKCKKDTIRKLNRPGKKKK